MAFKKKQDGGSVFKFEKQGDNLTGIYLGSVDFQGDYAPTKKHSFKTEQGVKVVFGQGHLTKLLEGEQPGILVRVTFTGTKKGKKGNPMKEYSLEIDDAFKASEEDLASFASEAEAEYDEAASDEDEETPMEEVKTAPVRKTTGAAPTTDRASRVAALLSKRTG